jgi:hypothetical protein
MNANLDFNFVAQNKTSFIVSNGGVLLLAVLLPQVLSCH